MSPSNKLTLERSHPNHWYNRSADLHASAGATWYAMQNDGKHGIAADLGFPPEFSLSIACWPVYHMLSGLALETATKAVLACRQEAIPATHNLNDLMGKIQFSVTSKERKLLQYYSDAVIWAGRYPTPNGCSDQKLTEFYDRAGDALSELVKEVKGLKFYRSNHVTDWDVFDPFWRRVINLFRFVG